MSPIVEAIRRMPAVPDRWRRTTVEGVWYLDVGSRVCIVYRTGAGGFWWRWPGGRGRCCRSLRRAMLEAQRAAVAWALGRGWARRERKRKPVGGPSSFSPRRAARAAAKLEAAEIDRVLVAAPAIIREVHEQLAPYVQP